MTYLIDRRLQGKNKSAVNRERFLRRYKSQIKDAVSRYLFEQTKRRPMVFPVVVEV